MQRVCKNVGDLIEGYFAKCTSYKQKIVALYVVELSVHFFWLALSISSLWCCVTQSPNTLQGFLVALACSTGPWSVVAVITHPRHLKNCAKSSNCCEIWKTAVQYMVNTFFVIVLLWMNIVCILRPPALGVYKSIAIVWLVSGWIWVVYSFSSPCIICCMMQCYEAEQARSPKHHRWAKSDADGGNTSCAEPFLQHRKLRRGTEQLADV